MFDRWVDQRDLAAFAARERLGRRQPQAVVQLDRVGDGDLAGGARATKKCASKRRATSTGGVIQFE